MQVSLGYPDKTDGNTPAIAQPSVDSSNVSVSGNVQINTVSDTWKNTAKLCNVTKCTFDSLMQAITELYMESEINHKEFEAFRIDRKNNDSQFACRGYNVKTNPYRTPADAEGNRNWLKEFELKLKEAKKRGDNKCAVTFEHVVSILSKLNEVR